MVILKKVTAKLMISLLILSSCASSPQNYKSSNSADLDKFSPKQSHSNRDLKADRLEFLSYQKLDSQEIKFLHDRVKKKEVGSDLRNLADVIAMRPDKTGDFLKTLIGIVTTYPRAGRHPTRSLDDPLVVLATQMQKDLGEHPDHQRVKEIGQEYSKSDKIFIRRAGETLLWGLRNRGKDA